MYAVGDGAAGIRRVERKVGQLVVEQKAAREVERAHAGFNRRGHHHHVAKLVHDAHVRGAVAFSHAAAPRWRRCKHTRLRGAHALGGGDQRRAGLEVILVEHRVDTRAGQGDKVRVGDVPIAVGIGQALGFAHQMHGLNGGLATLDVDASGGHGGEVKVIQNAQRLCHGNATGGRWPHAADHGAAVVATHGRSANRPVAGQVAHLGQAGGDDYRGGDAASADFDLVHNALRNRPGVEGVRAALRDAVQRGRVVGVFDDRAQGLGRQVFVQEVSPGIRVAQQVIARAADGGRHAPADAKAVTRQFYGGLKQFAPRLAAMVLMRQLQHANCTGRANRATTGAGASEGIAKVGQGVGFVGRADEAQVVFRGRSGGRFATVIAFDFVGRGFVMQHEGPTAQTA